MIILKIAPVLLFALVAGKDKKIELQDIEEDNLKSEKENDIDNLSSRDEAGNSETGPGKLQLELLKSGLLRYFEPSPNQQQRYVQQYAVTEPPERNAVVEPNGQYVGPTAQHVMLQYLSKMPMQVYLVPQYYNEMQEQINSQSGIQYATAAVNRVAPYQSPESVHNRVAPYQGPESVNNRVANYQSPESVQATNYVEVPAYVTPSGKPYIQQYSSPVRYVQYIQQPTVPPTPVAITPILTYQVPVAHYPSTLSAPPVLQKGYYQNEQYTESNKIEELHENEVESPRQYPAQTETSYTKFSAKEYPRYYSSRVPLREEKRLNPVPELPPPNPVILKGSPPHLSHIPKALPIYRPVNKPVYTSGGSFAQNTFTPTPHEVYGVPIKRKPVSLLESYIPSYVQLEYLKRGYSKDPLSAYEALSSARLFPSSPLSSRQYERGFLPNQMYQTAAGGITYGHYKRTPKPAK